eukprot:CAMPEP_0118689056 /NCGR_PEP_ID=MMETSP0800-20121206/9266_1 /TAXON_ID=210618 ORGANISM="Striatella unipunctata, Strain CCMP2910" /NCGR_SAMPLE_ID=MMETSP0800 /ASSEMBLY_ACC=CAM_ASM_000638 /LENGTH=302 /DNA_ID=CAMNT_0006586389 /DNA_START=128 /DNA_END=1033 /DNA_ORIENTATION=+
MARLCSAFSMSPNSVALVTGSTDGIGLTTAKNLAAMGYNVIVHGRDEERIKDACQNVEKFASRFREESGKIRTASVYSIKSDISTLDGCKKLFEEADAILTSNQLSLNILVNNAGVFAERKRMTSDDLEETFAVNVLATFAITSLLLERLLSSGSSRIVIASSISQSSHIEDWDDLQFKKRRYTAHRSYAESKLMDAMLAIEFASRLQDKGCGTETITCNCLDPGTVNTKMLLAGWGACGIDVEAALDETWLSTSEEVNEITGSYFMGRNRAKAAGAAYDKEERKRLWEVLTELAPEASKLW